MATETLSKKLDDMQERLYSLYQLDWMQRHGHTLQELVERLTDIYEDVDENMPDNLFSEFCIDDGFDGEIFVDKHEFMECEYLEADYIKEAWEW